MKTAVSTSLHQLPSFSAPNISNLSPRSSKLFEEVHSVLDSYSYTEVDSFNLLSSLSFQPSLVDDAVRQIVESYAGHEQGTWKMAHGRRRNNQQQSSSYSTGVVNGGKKLNSGNRTGANNGNINAGGRNTKGSNSNSNNNSPNPTNEGTFTQGNTTAAGGKTASSSFVPFPDDEDTTGANRTSEVRSQNLRGGRGGSGFGRVGATRGGGNFGRGGSNRGGGGGTYVGGEDGFKDGFNSNREGGNVGYRGARAILRREDMLNNSSKANSGSRRRGNTMNRGSVGPRGRGGGFYKSGNLDVPKDVNNPVDGVSSDAFIEEEKVYGDNLSAGLPASNVVEYSGDQVHGGNGEQAKEEGINGPNRLHPSKSLSRFGKMSSEKVEAEDKEGEENEGVDRGEGDLSSIPPVTDTTSNIEEKDVKLDDNVSKRLGEKVVGSAAVGDSATFSSYKNVRYESGVAIMPLKGGKVRGSSSRGGRGRGRGGVNLDHSFGDRKSPDMYSYNNPAKTAHAEFFSKYDSHRSTERSDSTNIQENDEFVKKNEKINSFHYSGKEKKQSGEGTFRNIVQNMDSKRNKQSTTSSQLRSATILKNATGKPSSSSSKLENLDDQQDNLAAFPCLCPPSSVKSSGAANDESTHAVVQLPTQRNPPLLTATRKYDTWADLAAGRAKYIQPPASSSSETSSTVTQVATDEAATLHAPSATRADNVSSSMSSSAVDSSNSSGSSLLLSLYDTSSQPLAKHSSVAATSSIGDASSSKETRSKDLWNTEIQPPTGPSSTTVQSPTIPSSNISSTVASTNNTASSPFHAQSTTDSSPKHQDKGSSPGVLLKDATHGASVVPTSLPVASPSSGVTVQGMAQQQLIPASSYQQGSPPADGLSSASQTVASCRPEPEHTVVMPKHPNPGSLHSDVNRVRLFFGSVPSSSRYGDAYVSVSPSPVLPGSGTEFLAFPSASIEEQHQQGSSYMGAERNFLKSVVMPPPSTVVTPTPNEVGTGTHRTYSASPDPLQQQNLLPVQQQLQQHQQEHPLTQQQQLIPGIHHTHPAGQHTPQYNVQQSQQHTHSSQQQQHTVLPQLSKQPLVNMRGDVVASLLTNHNMQPSSSTRVSANSSGVSVVQSNLQGGMMRGSSHVNMEGDYNSFGAPGLGLSTLSKLSSPSQSPLPPPSSMSNNESTSDPSTSQHIPLNMFTNMYKSAYSNSGSGATASNNLLSSTHNSNAALNRATAIQQHNMTLGGKSLLESLSANNTHPSFNGKGYADGLGNSSAHHHSSAIGVISSVSSLHPTVNNNRVSNETSTGRNIVTAAPSGNFIGNSGNFPSGPFRVQSHSIEEGSSVSGTTGSLKDVTGTQAQMNMKLSSHGVDKFSGSNVGVDGFLGRTEVGVEGGNDASNFGGDSALINSGTSAVSIGSVAEADNVPSRPSIAGKESSSTNNTNSRDTATQLQSNLIIQRSKSVIHNAVQNQNQNMPSDRSRFPPYRASFVSQSQRENVPFKKNSTEIGVNNSSQNLISSNSNKLPKNSAVGTSLYESSQQQKLPYQQQLYTTFQNSFPTANQQFLYESKQMHIEGGYEYPQSLLDVYNYSSPHLIQQLAQYRNNPYDNIQESNGIAASESSNFSSHNVSSLSSLSQFNSSTSADSTSNNNNNNTSSPTVTSSKFGNPRQGSSFSSKIPPAPSEVPQNQKILQNNGGSGGSQLTHHNSPHNQQHNSSTPFYSSGGFTYSSAPPGLTPAGGPEIHRQQQFNYAFPAGMGYPYNGVPYNAAYPQHVIHNYMVGSPFAGKGGPSMHAGYPNHFGMGYGEGFDDSVLSYGNAQSLNDISINFGNVQSSYDVGISPTTGLSSPHTHSQNTLASFGNSQEQRWPSNSTFDIPNNAASPDYHRSSSSNGYINNASDTTSSSASFYFANNLRMQQTEGVGPSNIAATTFVGGAVNQTTDSSPYNHSHTAGGWDTQHPGTASGGFSNTGASVHTQASQTRNNSSKHNHSYIMTSYPLVNVRNGPSASVSGHPHRGSIGNDQTPGNYLGYGNFAAQHGQYATHNPPGLSNNFYTDPSYIQGSGQLNAPAVGHAFNSYNSTLNWGNQ